MIVWIASYPKSGNTWLRMLLEYLTREHTAALSINDLKNVTGIASSREMFDRYAGVESSELAPTQVDQLRPKVFEALARGASERLYLKTHDAWRCVARDTPLFPGSVTDGVVYLVRNPLDVATSLRAYLSWDQDDAIRFMADRKAALGTQTLQLGPQVRQQLLDWSGHVSSWTRQTQLRVHVVRYEDLRLQPVATLTAIVGFLRIDCGPEKIRQALDAAAFEKLQQQEAAEGFHERPRYIERFFRRGLAGGWRDELSSRQAVKIIADHGETMREFGYLDTIGLPVF